MNFFWVVCAVTYQSFAPIIEEATELDCRSKTVYQCAAVYATVYNSPTTVLDKKFCYNITTDECNEILLENTSHKKKVLKLARNLMKRFRYMLHNLCLLRDREYTFKYENDYLDMILDILEADLEIYPKCKANVESVRQALAQQVLAGGKVINKKLTAIAAIHENVYNFCKTDLQLDFQLLKTRLQCHSRVTEDYTYIDGGYPIFDYASESDIPSTYLYGAPRSEEDPRPDIPDPIPLADRLEDRNGATDLGNPTKELEDSSDNKSKDASTSEEEEEEESKSWIYATVFTLLGVLALLTGAFAFWKHKQNNTGSLMWMGSSDF